MTEKISIKELEQEDGSLLLEIELDDTTESILTQRAEADGFTLEEFITKIITEDLEKKIEEAKTENI
jgi:hypothetical protein